MSRYDCTLERFLKDVANHEMEIISEDGITRHIRFKNPSTSNQYFDLTTFGDHLVFSGDMGNYTYQRVHDMFTFFRQDEMPDSANYYWDEKLESVCVRGGRKEWCEDSFKDVVYSDIEEHFEGVDVDIEKVKKVVSDVFKWYEIDSYENCERVLDEISDNIHEELELDYNFQDFWEYARGCEKFTYHYTWAQMAICWGVMKYDGKL